MKSKRFTTKLRAPAFAQHGGQDEHEQEHPAFA